MAGLEDLYREIILDHYRTPRNRGELDPPAVSAEGHNPLCGDEIRIFLDVSDGIVTDVKFSGSGCSISQSSASMMTSAVKGKDVAHVVALSKGGSNKDGTRLQAPSKNRSFRRKSNGAMK